MFNKDVFIVFNASDDKITKGFRFLVFVTLEICVFMQGFCVLYNNGYNGTDYFCHNINRLIV